MAFCFYLFLRAAAIVLGVACTWYSATTSWEHFGNLMGPLAAVSAAALFIFAEHAGRDRQWHHLLSMGVLGVLAAIISGAVVLQRNADTQATRLHAAASSNLPRAEAKAALDEAKTALRTAEAATRVECSSGRGSKCRDLERREAEARQRVEAKRSKLVELGAQVVEHPTASVLGDWAATFDRAMAVGPAIWLEVAAPALLAFGFAPLPQREPAPKKKVKRRRKPTRAPRKPAAPSAQAAKARPALKLVAANQN